MMMNPAVKGVKSRADYALLLTFDNGDRRVFDMKPFLDKGIFRDLKDVTKFRSVHICFDYRVG